MMREGLDGSLCISRGKRGAVVYECRAGCVETTLSNTHLIGHCVQGLVASRVRVTLVQ